MIGRWMSRAGACAVMVLLVSATAASACANYGRVKSLHGYVIVDFDQTATAPDGSGGTTTVAIDHSTGVMYFPSLKPLYINAGPPGHRKKLLLGFRGKPDAGVMTVDDSYRDAVLNTSGTQTADGFPDGTATLAFPPVGCKYDVTAGFKIDTQASGNYPEYPEKGELILAQSPVLHVQRSLNLKGSATVPWVNGETPTTGYFDSWGPDGSWGPWENALANTLPPSQSNPGAEIQWGFAPNTGPPAKHLFVFISTSWIRSGQTSLVYLTVTWKGHPANDALIKVAGQTVHSDHHGTATVSLSPSHPGHLSVTIRYHGKKSTKEIRVV